jgi:hypothetical protein
VAAGIFGSGDQITYMARMVGTCTFLIEHVVFGLGLGVAMAAGRGNAAGGRRRAGVA